VRERGEEVAIVAASLREGSRSAACGGLETCPLRVNLLTCEGGEEVAIVAASFREGSRSVVCGGLETCPLRYV
jgi:uncharacterized protein YoaH (UPF0181 family)